jgi:hypothetical protein
MRRILSLIVFIVGAAAFAMAQERDVKAPDPVPTFRVPPIYPDPLLQLPQPLPPTITPPNLEPVLHPVLQPQIRALHATALDVVPNFTVVDISIVGSAGYSTYAATIGQTELTRTNDAVHLLAAIEQHRSAAGPVYVNTTPLNLNRRAAIRASMDEANHSRKLPLRYVDGLDVLFSQSADRQELRVIDSGKDEDGDYYESARVTVNGQSFTMTVFSRLQAAAHALMTRIVAYFNSGKESSTIAIINAVRHRVAAEYDVPENHLYVKIKDQLANTRWVELRRLTDVRVQ